MISLNINYKYNKSELCEIGAKYDTDKSSQRKNVTNDRHCHPYTLFYDSLFKNQKDKSLNIAEIGILEGSSMLMWREYFKNSKIYGLEYHEQLIEKFLNNYDSTNINLSQIDVTKSENIANSFKSLGIMYDIIIEDSTHNFYDQVRVIFNTYQYLKPGGIMIIEDIYKKYNENAYIEVLSPILDQFEKYYFVTVDHYNKNSTGWDNDKLFVLVKKGDPIFTNNNKITIITPSYRVQNMEKLKASINFNYVNEWLIVYDGNHIKENPNIFENNNEQNKIREFVYKGDGISGNPQRNYALSNIRFEDTYLYFLDDDNIIHPDLYKLLDILDNDKIYTFNQQDRIKGDKFGIAVIDSAMVLIDYKKCKTARWSPNIYDADGLFILEHYLNNRENWIYVDNDLCFYNCI
jgi:predicted O-methyltransferase YrrM